MKISELWTSQRKRSEQLVLELAELEGTKPQVEAEYARMDEECIQLASHVSALKLAHSESWPAAEAELRGKRYARTEVKAAYWNRRNRITAELEAINGPRIRNAIQDILARLNTPATMNTESFYTASAEQMTRLTHNSAAMRKLRETGLAGIDELRKMQHRSLSEVEGKITEVRGALEAIALDSLEVDIVTPEQARGVVSRPESPRLQNVWISPQSTVIGQQSEAARINDLAGRLDKLERK